MANETNQASIIDFVATCPNGHLSDTQTKSAEAIADLIARHTLTAYCPTCGVTFQVPANTTRELMEKIAKSNL
jgi:hypothetical protein